jgi:hypothetical protein
VIVETFLIEKWRSMGFAMPNDGQTFTWDQYLEPVTNSVPIVGDLVGVSSEASDTISGIITYVDAPKSALLVYVPVAPGVGQYGRARWQNSLADQAESENWYPEDMALLSWIANLIV